MLSKKEILRSVLGKNVALFEHSDYPIIIINLNPGAANYPHLVTQVGDDMFETINSVNNKKAYYSINHIFRIERG